MKIEYRLTKDLPLPEAAFLYQEAGWFDKEETQESVAETLQKMFANSFMISCAFSGEGELLGLMRALSDGVSDAYILDLVVKKEFRKQGIGHKILRKLVTELKKCGIDWIVCIGVPGTESFYKNGGGEKMLSFTPYRFAESAGEEAQNE